METVPHMIPESGIMIIQDICSSNNSELLVPAYKSNVPRPSAVGAEMLHGGSGSSMLERSTAFNSLPK